MRVVLIGGPFRVESNLVFDSRTALQEDVGDYLIRSAASASLQWWEAATSFTQTLLSQDPRSDAWVMVAGPPLLRTNTEGGKAGRRLASILPGQAVALDAGDFRRTPVAPWTYANTTSHITFVRNPCSISEWTRCAPTAIIISGHDDPGPRGTRLIELATLWPTAVLILLHSPSIEREVRGLLAWAEAGRCPLSRTWSLSREQQNEHQIRMAARMRFGRQRPVVIEADFGITSAFLDGRAIPPERLSAATAFLQSRYDLSIDLWDIVRDSALSSLVAELERDHVVSNGEAHTRVPAEFLGKVREMELIRKQVTDELYGFCLGSWTIASDADFSWKLDDPEYPVKWTLRLDSTSFILYPTAEPGIGLPARVTGGQGWHHGIGWRIGIAPEGKPGLRTILDASITELRQVLSCHFRGSS